MKEFNEWARSYTYNGLTGDKWLIAKDAYCSAWFEQEARLVALELKRAELQEHLESLTPGGSEFHGGAGRCVEWVRARLATTGKIAAERNELRARVEEMAELCRRAAREMNNLGNITNWPPETPMSYAETINELRAAK